MKKVLIDYLLRNKKTFIIILILFYVGIAIGIVSVNNSNSIQKQELNTYIEELIENIKQSENIDTLNLLCLSIKENSKEVNYSSLFFFFLPFKYFFKTLDNSLLSIGLAK